MKYTDKYLQIIGFGDTDNDRITLQWAALCKPSAILKSIKLIQWPTIEQLTEQIEFINRQFDMIFDFTDDLDVRTGYHAPQPDSPQLSTETENHSRQPNSETPQAIE